MRRELVLWLVLIAAVRVLALPGQIDDLYRIDELYAGAAAQEVIAGRSLALRHLPWDPYAGGSVVVIWLTAALFTATGPELAVLKAIAIAGSVATLGVWLALVLRAFGGRAMRVVAVLFLAAPAELIRLNLMTWGNHAESALPGAGALLLLYRLYGRDGELGAAPRVDRSAWLLALAIGALSTVAVFFSMIAGIFAGTVVLILAALGRRAVPGRIAAGLGVGAILGSIPWVTYNLSLRFAGFEILGNTLQIVPSRAPAKLLALATHHWRAFLRTHPSPVGAGLWILTGLALAWSVWWVVSRTRFGARVPAEALLVLPVVLFSLLFAVSGFDIAPIEVGVIRFRYLAPVAPPLLALLGARLSRLRPHIAVAMMVAALAPRLAGLDLDAATTSQLTGSSLRNFRLTGRNGASYLAYGWHVFDSIGGIGPTMDVVDAIEPATARRAAGLGVGIGWILAHRMPTFAGRPDALTRVVDAIETLPDRPLPALFERLGVSLRSPGLLQLTAADLDAALTRLQRLRRPSAELDPVIAALLSVHLQGEQAQWADVGRTLAATPAVWRGPISRGAGMAASARQRLGRAVWSGPPPAGLDPEQYAFGLGLDWGWARLCGAEQEPPDGLAPAGVALAVELFEPDDPVHRRVLSQGHGLHQVRERP